MECYCVARNKPMRSKRTKPQTATVISLWFEGLLAYPELYCDSTFLKNFRCSWFSEFDPCSKLGHLMILMCQPQAH